MRAARLLFLAIVAHAGASVLAGPRLLLSADAEGHVSPCGSCPTEVGFGGLDRRATLIAQRRAADPGLVLVEAGNFFAGPDTVDDDGRVLAEVYKRLKYDAINICHRDLRFGPDKVIENLRGLPCVSANLLDARTGRPLFAPHVVVTRADGRTAFVGLCEVPELDALPWIKTQLASVRIAPPLDVLDRAVANAAAESDRVVLMYYGSPGGLEQVRQHLAAAKSQSVVAILVGGVREAPRSAGVPVLAVAGPHGKYMADLPSVGSAEGVEQRPVLPTIAPDAATADLIAGHAAGRP